MDTSPSTAKPMTTGRLCTSLGLHRSRLRRWIQAGLLTPTKEPHGQQEWWVFDANQAEKARRLLVLVERFGVRLGRAPERLAELEAMESKRGKPYAVPQGTSSGASSA